MGQRFMEDNLSLKYNYKDPTNKAMNLLKVAT